ncbi:MAG TPA: porin [Planctomycetota bacterium]|nr:porin [Planctomycetota bacterium]
MVRIRGTVAALLAAMFLVLPCAVRAGEATTAEVDALKKDVEELRRKLQTVSTSMPKTSVDKALENKYGPNAKVTTKSGKLTLSGLVQVWYTSIENDNRGLFDIPGTVADTNEASDNDSFRVRRSEIKFNMDIHENVTAVVMIDPAREALSFPALPSNQGVKRVNNIAPELAEDLVGSTTAVSRVQLGSGGVPRLLKDAYINYHGVIPHHDFTIGQFKPRFGEEGVRSASQLDFAERSFLGQIGDNRDLGLQVHGTWWDERFQYWVGAFNGAGNYHFSGGDSANRADDNDEKDILLSAIVRPLWKNECWGSLELGYSFQGGTKGESAPRDRDADPINGLNRRQTWAHRMAAWASYMPGGPAKGAWIRGEWGMFHDRHAPGSVFIYDGDDFQTRGAPFSVQHWYVAGGYKISDSVFCDSAPGWLKPFEFALRYESFQNVNIAVGDARHTQLFRTQVYSGGINYYIKGHNAKIQAMYNVVDDPESDLGDDLPFHQVRNNNFIVSFQVAF